MHKFGLGLEKFQCEDLGTNNGMTVSFHSLADISFLFLTSVNLVCFIFSSYLVIHFAKSRAFFPHVIMLHARKPCALFAKLFGNVSISVKGFDFPAEAFL